MKLQIAYDFTDLDKALEVARQTAEYADILEVGTTLLFRYGITAAYEFKKEFPNTKLLVDAKLVDRVSDIVPLLCKSAADYITVLAGTHNSIITQAAHLAHKEDTLVMLDLIDAPSMGQAARDAKALGVDLLLYHNGHDAEQESEEILGEWQLVRENSELPIFISAGINEQTLSEILALKPQGIVVGTAITRADNPAEVARNIRERIAS